jgi:hypothetical protein
VPVEDIADSCFGLLVRDIDDLEKAPGAPRLAPGQSFSGLLFPGLGEIWVNAWEGTQWPSRRRFTIGHELGHWVMHSAGGQTIFCRSQSVQPDEPDPPAVPLIEEEAQVFSAALLMPEHLIREHHARLAGDVDSLCALFGASRVAMNRRIADVLAP